EKLACCAVGGRQATTPVAIGARGRCPPPWAVCAPAEALGGLEGRRVRQGRGGQRRGAGGRIQMLAPPPCAAGGGARGGRGSGGRGGGGGGLGPLGPCGGRPGACRGVGRPGGGRRGAPPRGGGQGGPPPPPRLSPAGRARGEASCPPGLVPGVCTGGRG